MNSAARGLSLSYEPPVRDVLFGYVIALGASLAYLFGAGYGAIAEGIPWYTRWAWSLLVDGLRREAHPMALKGFLWAAISIAVFVLAWIVTGMLIYWRHPFIAEAMNDTLTVAVIWFFARHEERGRG